MFIYMNFVYNKRVRNKLKRSIQIEKKSHRGIMVILSLSLIEFELQFNSKLQESSPYIFKS